MATTYDLDVVSLVAVRVTLCGPAGTGVRSCSRFPPHLPAPTSSPIPMSRTSKRDCCTRQRAAKTGISVSRASGIAAQAILLRGPRTAPVKASGGIAGVKTATTVIGAVVPTRLMVLDVSVQLMEDAGPTMGRRGPAYDQR